MAARMRVSPESIVDTQELQRALAQHRQGQLQQAESIYRKLGALDARHFGVAHMLGLALLQQGKAVEAVQQLQRALLLDPDSSEAQRFGELVEAGAAARRAQVRHDRRVAAYVEHNADPEYEQALKVSTDAAFERGGF